MIENGVSNIAYFRTDGGNSKLYTQEYVDEKDKEIERLTAESTEWESKYYDMQDNYHNANEEIERLNKDLETSIEICNNRQKEIVRLNNIINELEKWLEESIEKHTDDYIDWKYDRNVYLAGSEKLQNVFDKLQELKGSNDNG